MGERSDDVRDLTGKEGSPQQPQVDGPVTPRAHRRMLDDFRQRVDRFWGNAGAAAMKRALDDDERQPRRLAPASALRSRMRETLAILESRPTHREFRLQKGLTYRDGRLIALWGDERPLAPDDRLLVVTTTTTILDADSVAVETDVLVFERPAQR